MKSKVLEIKLTQESPLKVNSLNTILKDFNEIEGFQELSPVGNETTYYLVKEKSDINESPSFSLNGDSFKALKNDCFLSTTIDYADREAVRRHIKRLEDAIFTKKVQNQEQYNLACKKTEELKKMLEKHQKESSISKHDLQKIYSKKISDLRNDESGLKTGIFHLKERVYRLELEISAIDKEINDFSEDCQIKDNEKRKFISLHQKKISEISMLNEALKNENKGLAINNNELYDQALQIVHSSSPTH